MNFIVDQGNTFTKLALFEEDKLLVSETVKELNEEKIISFISNRPIKKGIISSVRKEIDKGLLKKYNLMQLTHLTPIPLQIKYKTPETLGVDRIAASVGAKLQINEAGVLVVDIGTCVTFDFINSKNEYLGGSIAPGFEMRFKALHQFTGKLPLIKFDKEKIALIGDSTESSMLSGVYNGMKSELEGMISQYVAQYGKVNIVLTGGDRNLFDLEPKNRIFANEFLVLEGLNEILKYNAE